MTLEQFFAENREVAIAFSGGVDSFFTLIKGQKEISDVVFIHGFDMSIKALERRPFNLYARPRWPTRIMSQTPSR